MYSLWRMIYIYLTRFIAYLYKNTLVNKIKILNTYDDFLGESTNLGVYDIVLLDIMLSSDPSKWWLQILEHIRKHYFQVPIVIMSSISEYSFLETAFSLGAHDYIIKPFRVRELQIRAQRWFQNYMFSEYYNHDSRLDYHGLVYHPSRNKFYYRNNVISLSRWNKYLLSLFLVNRSKLLTHMFLIEKIWWYSDGISEKNLRIKILRLKRCLEWFGMDSWIHTIHGEGYLFEYVNPDQS